MVNTGSIVVNSLLQTLMKPEMSTASKFDYINDYIKVSSFPLKSYLSIFLL